MGSPLGVILQFGADSTGAQQDVETLRQKIAAVSEDSASSIEKFSKRGVAAYEELQREYIRLGSQTANLRGALSENESQQTRLNQVISAGGADAVQATADLQRLEAEHGKLAQALQSSRAEFRAVSQASSAMMRENSLARENARSLASTFGIQLPESISHFITQSAVAQDALASMFSVTIVAAFAGAVIETGERLYEFAVKAEEEYNGVAEAEKAMKRAGEENIQVLNDAAKASTEFAQKQVLLINAQIVAAETSVDHLRSQDQVLAQQVPIVGQLVQAYHYWFGQSKDLKTSEEGLNALLAERDKLIKILGEDEDGEKKNAAEAAKKAAEAAAKQAEIYDRARQAIAGAKAELPPFIVEIDRLSASIDHQNSGLQNSLDILKSYQQIAKEMSATPLQLGFAVPDATGVINTQIQMTGQLTAAQQALLPSEEELRRANAELTRDYPQLTAAERAEWAQILLTSDAYRKHIDEASKVKSTNSDLSSSFRSLAQQARTAFSQMAGELRGWGGVATRVFDEVSNAIQGQIEIQRKQVQEHQIAQVSMTKATLDGLKELAPVQAVVDFAKGLEELAEAFMGHPGAAAAAAQDFAAAAVWGTVGAFQIASMAGAFSGGGGSSAVSGVAASAASGGSASATADHSLASGAASAQAASSNQQQTIQIIFQGDVYGGEAATNEIIRKVSDAVQFNRMRLVASHNVTGKTL